MFQLARVVWWDVLETFRTNSADSHWLELNTLSSAAMGDQVSGLRCRDQRGEYPWTRAHTDQQLHEGGEAPVFWSSRGPCWGFAGEPRRRGAVQILQPCYLEALEPTSLSAWQQGAWGGRPWWREVRGASWRAGASEVPQNMKTQDEKGKSLEGDHCSGLPHGLLDLVGLSPTPAKETTVFRTASASPGSDPPHQAPSRERTRSEHNGQQQWW